jgi:hypothetical protein
MLFPFFELIGCADESRRALDALGEAVLLYEALDFVLKLGLL